MSALVRLGIDELGPITAMPASPAQSQTRDAFGFKWNNREAFDSQQMQQLTREWLLRKYCDSDPGRLAEWLEGGRKLILDAGCGAGVSALCLFGETLNEHDYLGVDISDSVAVAQARFHERGIAADFLQTDIMQLPIPDGSLDVIFSEGVLHHTDDTSAAIVALARKLRKGGLFLFYVYAKKGPVREFTDDFVREHLGPLSDEAAWAAIEPITELGIALGELGATVNVPRPIPLLGIEAGLVDVQRLFYYAFMKAYYRPELTVAEMNHINFDWYRPLNCQRHTADEVMSYCTRAGLRVLRMHSEPSGHSIVAKAIAGPGDSDPE